MGLPSADNKLVIVVVADHILEYDQFCAFTPSLVAKIFMGYIFKLHGMSTSVISNWIFIFTSNFGKRHLKFRYPIKC